MIQGFIGVSRKMNLLRKFRSNLNDYLRDQFMFGMHCDSSKKMLLKEENLTFDLTVKKALANRDARYETIPRF